MVNVDAICHLALSYISWLSFRVREREWAWKGNEKITRYHLARINERITKTNESTEMRDASQANIQFINDGHDIVKLIWWDTSQKNCMWKKRRMMSILAGCWDK